MSTRKITEYFHNHMAEQFVESFTESANNIYYIAASKNTQFDDDANPPAPDLSYKESFYNIHNDMIFAKKLSESDYSYMIKFVKWEEGQTYDMYDDEDPLLFDKNFFVVSEESDSNYSVFKCIYNGKIERDGSIYVPPVSDKPVSNETSYDDEYYRTADGYVWKYMCSINRKEYEKFATNFYVPIVENQSVKNAAKNGSIDHILLETVGSNYNGYAYGSIKQSAVAGNPKIFSLQTDENLDILTFDVDLSQGQFKEFHSGSIVKKIFFRLENGNMWYNNGSIVFGKLYSINSTVVRVVLSSNLKFPKTVEGIFQTTNNIQSGSMSAYGRIISSRRDLIPNLSSNTDFYKNSSFYIRSGKGAGQLKTITEYIVTGNERRILIDENFAVTPDNTSRFEIGPRVIITGDGTSTSGVGEAKAIVNMDESSNTIHSIEMIDTGKDYSWATVEITSNTGYIDVTTGNNIQTNDATGRAIISPPGGHGSNIYEELNATSVCISTVFDSKADTKIPTQNDYRTISLIKDPLFNNLTLTLNESSLLWIVGEKVTQPTNGAHGYVSGRNGNSLTLKDIKGFFTVGDEIVSSRGSNNVSDYINSINKNFSIADQRTKIAITMISDGPNGTGFLHDEEVVQEPQNSTAIVHSISDNRIDVINVKGVWNSSDEASGFIAEIKGKTSGAIATVEGILYPDIKKYTGKILSIENFIPISRSENQTERVKIILEF